MSGERTLIIIIELEHIHSLSICFQHLNILKKYQYCSISMCILLWCSMIRKVFVKWVKISILFFEPSIHLPHPYHRQRGELYAYAIENIIRVDIIPSEFQPFLALSIFTSLNHVVKNIQTHSHWMNFTIFYLCSIIRS